MMPAEQANNELKVRQFAFRMTKEVKNFIKYGGTKSEAAEGLMRVVEDLLKEEKSGGK